MEEINALEERVPPFGGLPPGEQVMLAISIAAGEMGSRIEAILRSRAPALTHSRYNALRILRGAGSTGLSCTEIAERLLLSPPDVTRLMDPLVEGGLVTRAPNPADRRVVLQRLTKLGSDLLSELDGDLSVVYDAISEGLGPELMDQLVFGCETFIAVARNVGDPSNERASAEVPG